MTPKTFSSKPAENARLKPRLGSSAILAAALIGAGAVGFATANYVVPSSAFAETAQDSSSSVIAGVPNFVDLAKKVTPAVVSINVKGEEDVDDDDNNMGIPGMPDIPKDSPFYQFFKRFGQIPNNGGHGHHEEPMRAQGSGFFISPDGYLVTNNHVVEGADTINITTEHGDKYPAKVIGTDSRTDIALLKVKVPAGKSFPYVELSNKDPQVGEWVLAVGNPFGLGGTVTAGIISAHNRDIGSGPYDYLQIDAPVNRGNSGGPTFTLDGKVVGMNTAIYSPSGGSVGIAFDIPAALVKEVVTQLKTHGSVERGWLGVVIQNVSDDIADGVGLDKAEGALVTQVSEDGPAAGTGIKAGDVITKVNGKDVKDSRDLARKIADLHPNTTVKLDIVRYGSKKEIDVKLGTFPNGKKLAELENDNGEDHPGPAKVGQEMKSLGMTLAPASSVDGAGNQGVVITDLDPNSDAADKGLKVGDVILQIGGEDVSKPEDVSAGIKKAMAMAKSKDKAKVNVILRIKSGDRTAFVALSLKKAA